MDYYYISMGEFEKMISKDSFVENAKFGDNRYGTSKMTIENLTKSGRVVVLDIEMEVCVSSFVQYMYNSKLAHEYGRASNKSRNPQSKRASSSFPHHL